VSSSVGEHHLATGLGLVGTLKNAGKVAGPTLAGLMIARLGYEPTFLLMGTGLLASAGVLAAVLLVRQHPRLARKRRQSGAAAAQNRL
jgi:predicted MFS family arabinose efflux permease